MSTWTEEQKAAITCRGGSLLVSAAAGAGKTAVLVERILQRILDPHNPCDVDRLLVVTFTNAAAQEMKERIARELAARQTENPQGRNLRRQLLLLGKASISTLHSFCLEIIRQNYYSLHLPEGLSLDPRFRIANDIEAVLLKLETLEELFEQKYAGEEQLFLELVECFGGERDDRLLQDLVLKLYDYSCSQPDPLVWLERVTAVFQANLEEDAIQNLFLNLKESLVLPLEEAAQLLAAAGEAARRPGGPACYFSQLQQEEARLKEVSSLLYGTKKGSSWPEIFAVLRGITFAKLQACRDKEVDEELKSEAVGLRNKAKDAVKKLQKEVLARSPEEYLQDMQEMAPLMKSLVHLVEEFSLSYLKAKLERNLIDFSDIEHFALRLLKEGDKPSGLAASLRKKYEEVLVDEYQDINSVQEAILQLVSRQGEEANLFMVGDVKQSIYHFRLAEPGLFLAKYAGFARYESGRKGLRQKIMLTRNFRSRKTILDGVNYLFRQIMDASLGGIVYDADAELVCGAEYPAAQSNEAMAIEVHLIEREDEPQGEEGDDIPDALQLEARLVGRKIKEVLGRQVWDREKGEYRPMCCRDIVVLLRSAKNAAGLFLEEFRRMNIPAYAELNTGYLEAQEVQVMLALLKIIDNPHQDIPLVAVLRSAIVGLTAEQLVEIRLHHPAADFFNSVRLAARREEGEMRQVLRDFLKNLHSWRTYARRHSLAELIWLLYRETGYYDYTGAMPGGKQRQANLRALHDRAKQYEDTTMKGLFRFLRFLEKMEESGSDLGTARPLGEKEDVVRIMSIHKSKGLEFPVVVLAGLGKKFNHQDLREDILLDRDLGLGPVKVDYERRLKYPTLAKIAVQNKLKRELLAEEARILYVAMTRARESLIMVGTIGDIAKKTKRWQRVAALCGWELPPGIIQGAGSFFDWIGPCLLRHRAGEALYAYAGLVPKFNRVLRDDPSNWDIQIWSPSSLRQKSDIVLQQEENLQKAAWLQPVEESAELKAMVEKRLGWTYPYAVLADIPAKLSVTEIKHRYHTLTQDEMGSQVLTRWRDFGIKPRFLREERGLSAQDKGTALHLVMRHLDLRRTLTQEDIRAQVMGFVEKGLLSKDQGESIPTDLVAKFFHSPWGRRMLASPEVMREVPFTLLLPAERVFADKTPLYGRKILVQGTIDCLFAEREGYVLLDYKTDLVSREKKDALKERYGQQLSLYAEAVKAILGKPVMEKVLYSFALADALVLGE